MRVLTYIRRTMLKCLKIVRNNRILDENVSTKEVNEVGILLLEYK